MADQLHTVCAACGAVNRLSAARLGDAAGAKCGSCRQPLLPEHPPSVSQARFDAFVGKSDIPVLVDFWAPWCGPCRTLAPILERSAKRLAPDVRVVKVNIDEAPQLAGRLGVQAAPTLAVFRRGREIARTSGVMPEAQLTDWVRSAVA